MRREFCAAILSLVAVISVQASDSNGLGNYLIQNGYGRAPLIHPVNLFHLQVRSNDKRGSLIVDTGAPGSLVFRSSVKQLGLTEIKTTKQVNGAFGRARDVFGRATIDVLSAGNCKLNNVQVAIATGSGQSMLDNNRPDGVLGLRELFRYGAVLDLKNRSAYFRQSQAQNISSNQIRSILLGQGYVPVPFSVNDSHLQVPGAVNGVPCRFVLDTGAYLTVFSQYFASRAGLKTIPTPFIGRGLGRSTHVGMVKFNSLRVGNFEIVNGSATVGPLNPEVFGSHSEIAGLVGAEYLGMDWAVFDFTGNTLYLRPRGR